MKGDLEHRAEVAVPVTSRRKFIIAAAAAGGAGILSAGLGPITAHGSNDKAAQFVIPPATNDVTPFKVHVPQAALDDLKKRLATARWPDKETVTNWSQVYRWPKHMRSLNTGALTTIGVVLRAH